ncbi:MAG TPA: hypothetical protein VHW65_03455 [Gemmatimonadales bacterium]|jgi:hypothetical protein|nr:hypothetical protein [Gemmatimonadales bacterium]
MLLSKALRGAAVVVVLAACGGSPPAPVVTNAPTGKDSTAATTAAAAHVPRPRRAQFDTAAAAGQRPLARESYQYRGTARDPFRPVLTLAQSGPELVDLKLVSIIYNPDSPERSTAQFSETGSARRYVWHPGDHYGRISVVSMSQTDVTLREDDFGIERRQNYTLRKPEDGTP